MTDEPAANVENVEGAAQDTAAELVPRDEPLSPELAEIVLAADQTNAIKNVRDGGTLPGPHRKELRGLALTAPAARFARVNALVEKWAAGGTLSEEQRAEVLALRPDFQFGPDELREIAVERLGDALPPARTGPAPMSTVGHEQATREDVAKWGETYATRRRQLFRWIAEGKAHADPCPLDRPELMPVWWKRRMKQRVPERILLAAAKVAKVEGAQQNPEAEGAGPPAVPSAGLAASEVIEGETVRQARQIVGLCFAKLSEALGKNPPDLDAAHLWQVRWEKSAESLRKQERDDRAAQKEAGGLLSKTQVVNELAQLVEALRLAHRGMTGKILAEIERNVGERRFRRILRLIKPRLSAAIESVRQREASLFLTLESLRTPSEARDAFTLEAAA